MSIVTAKPGTSFVQTTNNTVTTIYTSTNLAAAQGLVIQYNILAVDTTDGTVSGFSGYAKIYSSDGSSSTASNVYGTNNNIDGNISTASVSATTNGFDALILQVTGVNGKTIKWYASVIATSNF